MMMATRGSAISHAVLSKTDRPPFSIFPYHAHRQSAERPIIYPTATTCDYNTPRKGPRPYKKFTSGLFRRGPRPVRQSAQRSTYGVAAQVREGHHDMASVSGAGHQALIPTLDARKPRAFDGHLVVTIECGADDDIGHGEPLAQQIRLIGELAFDNRVVGAQPPGGIGGGRGVLPVGGRPDRQPEELIEIGRQRGLHPIHPLVGLGASPRIAIP